MISALRDIRKAQKVMRIVDLSSCQETADEAHANRVQKNRASQIEELVGNAKMIQYMFCRRVHPSEKHASAIRSFGPPVKKKLSIV